MKGEIVDQSSFNIGGMVLAALYIIVPLIGAAVSIWRREIKDLKSRLEVLLVWYLFIGVGIQGIVSGVVQIFMSDKVAGYVGWAGSPFVVELGMANLAFGILGIISLWQRKGFRTATALGYGLFLVLVAFGHIYDALFKGRLSVGNLGPTLWADLIVGFILLVLISLRPKH